MSAAKKKVKFAAVVSVGPIDSCGYQYFSKIILTNFCNLFDKVYVISSTKKTRKLPIKRKNLELFSNIKTWIDGPFLWVNNITPFINKYLKRDKIDFIILIHINQDINFDNMEKIRRHLLYLKTNNIPWDWIYKKYQTHDCLYHASSMLPWIINVKFIDAFEIIPDGILFGTQKYYIKRKFLPKPPFYIVDLFGGFTFKDVEDRAKFLVKYKDEDLKMYRSSNHIILKYLRHKLLNMVVDKYPFYNYLSKQFPSNSLSTLINLSYTHKIYSFLKKIRSILRYAIT